jgi:hypothetical protein
MEIIILFLLFFAVVVIVCGLFLQFSARLVGVNDATLGEAVKIIIYTAIVSFIASLIFGIMGSSLLGQIAGLLIALYFIASIFGVTYGKAFIIWLVNILVWIGVVVLLTVLFLGPRL